MNRLTLPHYGGKGHYMKCSENLACNGNCGDCDSLDEIIEKLAEYEDKEEQKPQTNADRVRPVKRRWAILLQLTQLLPIKTWQPKNGTGGLTMRLIDADALRKVISGLRVIVTGVRHGKGLLCELVTEYHRNILKAIDEAPTIDAVPVVRCKDCKHWKKGDFQAGHSIDHMEWGGGCPYAQFARYESDFCSRGERRSEDEN